MAKTGTVKATWPGHKRPVHDRDMYGPLPAPNIPWAKAKSPYSRKGPAPA